VELDPTRMCALLVGLPDVTVLGVDDDDRHGPLLVHVETRGPRPRCPDCAGALRVKDRPVVVLVDLPCFGRPTRLVWRKFRWSCPDGSCLVGSFTENAATIGAARLVMTDRAGRWVTEQVGRNGRTVAEVARELDCDWHTIMDTVLAYGTPLVDDDPDRIGPVTALGLDETLFVRLGRFHTQQWATTIADVRAGRRPQSALRKKVTPDEPRPAVRVPLHPLGRRREA
jgi:transposase